jgi:hypothetical protein
MSAETPHLSDRELDRLSEDPRNKVLRWAEPGERRADALSADAILAKVEKLKREVVRIKSEKPHLNQFLLRYELLRDGTGEWAPFAEHYPFFWAKVTSSASTRRDMIAIHAAIDARRKLESGQIATEQECEALIQNDMIALNLDSAKKDKKAKKRAGDDERRLLEHARLRRVWLERQFADVLVPTEELKSRGIEFSPAKSCIDEIVKEHEEIDAALAKKEGKEKREAEIARLTPELILSARALVELQVKVARKCMGLPPLLDPKGYNFMPTYSRAAQLEFTWTDEFIKPPKELVVPVA